MSKVLLTTKTKTSSKRTKKAIQPMITHAMGFIGDRAIQAKELLAQGINPVTVKVILKQEKPLSAPKSLVTAVSKAIAKTGFGESYDCSKTLYNALPKAMKNMTNRKAFSTAMFFNGYVNIGQKFSPEYKQIVF